MRSGLRVNATGSCPLTMRRLTARSMRQVGSWCWAWVWNRNVQPRAPSGMVNPNPYLSARPLPKAAWKARKLPVSGGWLFPTSSLTNGCEFQLPREVLETGRLFHHPSCSHCAAGIHLLDLLTRHGIPISRHNTTPLSGMLSTVCTCTYLGRRGAQSCTTIPNQDHISALDDTRGNPCACRARGLTCNYYCLTVGSWHDRRRLAARSLHLSSIVGDRELCNSSAQNQHGILQPHACPMPRPTPFVRPSAGVPPSKLRPPCEVPGTRLLGRTMRHHPQCLPANCRCLANWG